MTVEESMRPRGFSEPKDTLQKHILKDPGNHPPSHFKDRMSPMRFAMRQELLRFTDTQSVKLYEWQRAHRTKVRDIFFAYTSSLGSHTFYVLCLPLPAFMGHFHLVHDMVYLLGYSIYVSGYLKDYWCLPRPRSPPLHRITFSAYTTMEYGAPSSHAANATVVTLLLLSHIWSSSESSVFTKLMFSAMTFSYYFTLVGGRIYCGMHGLLDIISGSLVGVFCFVLKHFLAKFVLQDFRIGDHWWSPLLSVAFALAILFTHVRPIDECPCFEDSVAFVGVISGLECGEWFLQRSNLEPGAGMGLEKGMALFLLRLLVGIPLIVIWKYVVSKPLVYSALIHVFQVPDDRADKLAKRQAAKKESTTVCPLYIGEAKIDIIGRFIIYAGVPVTVIVVCPLAFAALNIMSE